MLDSVVSYTYFDSTAAEFISQHGRIRKYLSTFGYTDFYPKFRNLQDIFESIEYFTLPTEFVPAQLDARDSEQRTGLIIS